MRTLTIFLLIFNLANSVNIALAEETPLVANLSEHLVAISTDFTGTEVLLFGATDGPGDLAIVIRGPDKTIALRKKSRVGPIWANTEKITVQNVPSFYKVMSSRSLQEFASKKSLALHEIGLDNLKLGFPDKSLSNATEENYKQAVIRLNIAEGIYDPNIGNVSLLANRLFRANISLPSNIPTGNYKVSVYLYRAGDLVSGEYVPLIISKIGVGAEVYNFAHQVGAIYGIIAIFIAVFSGWAAEAAFRRK